MGLKNPAVCCLQGERPRKASGLIQFESKGLRTEEWMFEIQVQMPEKMRSDTTTSQKAKRHVLPSSTSGSIQALDGCMMSTHTEEGSLLSLLIQC